MSSFLYQSSDARCLAQQASREAKIAAHRASNILLSPRGNEMSRNNNNRSDLDRWLIPTTPSPPRSMASSTASSSPELRSKRSPLRFSEIQAYFNPPALSSYPPLLIASTNATTTTTAKTSVNMDSNSIMSFSVRRSWRAIDKKPHQLGLDRQKKPAPTPPVVVYNPGSTLTPRQSRHYNYRTFERDQYYDYLRNSHRYYQQTLAQMSRESRLRTLRRANILRQSGR
jgi:hypothetical protein